MEKSKFTNFNSTDLIKNQEFFNTFENILTCTFCIGFLINPRECHECQNSYCSECLKSWEPNKGSNPLCPMKCTQDIFSNSHRGIIQILEQLVVKCYNCSTYLNYNELIQHVKNNSCAKLKFARGGKQLDINSLNTEYSSNEYNPELEIYIKKKIKNSLMTQNKKLDNFKNSIAIKNIQIENLKYSFETILKDYDIIKESHESIKLSEQTLRKENAKLKLRNFKLQLDYDSLKNTQEYKYFNMIIDVFSFIKSKKSCKKYYVPMLEFIKGIVDLNKKFLTAEEFKNLLSFHHFKKDYANNELIEKILEKILESHIEYFELDENLANYVIDKFLKVFSLESKKSEEIVENLKLLNYAILFNIKKYIFGESLSNLINICIKLVQNKFSLIRLNSSLVIVNLAGHNISFSKLKINEILKVLESTIKTKKISAREKKEYFDEARDCAILSMGKIIYTHYKYFDSKVWVSKWLSFFPLEITFIQKKSYDFLTGILYNEEIEWREVLYGNDNINLPSIIIILANVLETDHINKDSKEEIKKFFAELIDKNSFHKFIEFAKRDSKLKILEILNNQFPEV